MPESSPSHLRKAPVPRHDRKCDLRAQDGCIGVTCYITCEAVHVTRKTCSASRACWISALHLSVPQSPTTTMRWRR
ncbi:hypothetical protein RSAG8_06592, partial [Rhizoctonia solani AG-8 WAC10335]